MFNPHTKFEVCTITCNEDLKGNANYKNSRFEPRFGGLRGNARGCEWQTDGHMMTASTRAIIASCG